MTNQILHNPHAGEILKEEFLKPLNISQNSLAKAIDVPSNRIHAIVKGTRRITANTDLRLCKFFDLSNGYFLRLQIDYEIMEMNKQIKAELHRIKTYNHNIHTTAA